MAGGRFTIGRLTGGLDDEGGAVRRIGGRLARVVDAGRVIGEGVEATDCRPAVPAASDVADSDVAEGDVDEGETVRKSLRRNGRASAARATMVATAARGAELAALLPPPAMKLLTRKISSSVRPASAPLPSTPAFEHMSTRTLLSSFSSRASE